LFSGAAFAVLAESLPGFGLLLREVFALSVPDEALALLLSLLEEAASEPPPDDDDVEAEPGEELLCA